jgi:hypothetical protein
MSMLGTIWGALVALCSVTAISSIPASAQGQKSNVIFITGDDIGWMQPSPVERRMHFPCNPFEKTVNPTDTLGE